MKALIVVDVVWDFIPVGEEAYNNKMGGALAVPNGEEVVPVINKLLPEFDLVIFTCEEHPDDMECFASQHKDKVLFDTYINAQGKKDTLWPDHCIKGTKGAEFHDDLDFGAIKGDFYIFKKGLKKDFHPYSGFGAEGLADFLKERGVTENVVVGLATDYCAGDTAMDSVEEGFKTTVIWDACRGIADDLTPTLNKFFDAGINVIDSDMFHEKN